MIDDAPKCIIKPSKIEGNGLFVKASIKTGEVVVDYAKIQNFTLKSFSDLTPEEINKCRWIGVNEEECLVPVTEMKFFSVNHSNSPNCLWVKEKQILAALRDIDIGEEITYDYTLDIKPKSWEKPSWI